MKNILFIAIDDLNDWTNKLGGYSGKVITPNLDKLMGSGVTFNNAYSQVAICNPSRTSVLTGKNPLNTQVFNNQTDWESTVNPSETLFGVLKANGYQSVGVGKLFHTGASTAANNAMFDSYNYLGQDQTGINLGGKPVGPYNGTEPLTDEKSVDYLLDFLDNYVPGNQPLLLSAGFLSPHTDWVVPQRFFDLYPLDSIQIDAVPNDIGDIPQFALDNAGQNLPWSQADVPDILTWKKLIQGYLASISYVDEQLGKVIDSLDQSAIANNTSVVLWSDHGYHLGDKDFWHKFTLWDNAAKAPLVIRDPDLGNAGKVINDVVELTDLFPTVLDLVNVSNTGLELDGKSLVPKINGTADSTVPNRAFTWMYGSVSIRTDQYRYTIYEDGSVELYDVLNDPELVDNLAGEASLAGVQSELESTLKSEFNLIGYGATDAVLNGTEQNDVFSTINANQIAQGGAGNDIYFLNGNTVIVEESSGGTRDMIVTTNQNYTLPDNVEVLEVKNISDKIYGNATDNLIVANALFISSGDGNDTVRAGLRANLVYLGTGNDFVNSYAGADTVYGGTGDDTITFYNDFPYSGIDNDTAYGGDGNDFIQGEWGYDFLIGEQGNDTLQGGQNNDYLFGGFDNDSLDGGNGNDFLYSGIGNDTAYGGDGNDFIQGEWGYDFLIGEQGNDTLQGGQNNDYLFGGFDNDSLDGGNDNDFLYSGIGNDTAYGGSGNDTAYGGDGSDFIQGEWGDDLLTAGAGSDTLVGGQNSDIFAYISANDSLVNQRDLIADFTLGADKLWLNFTAFAPTEIPSVNNIDEANAYFDSSSIKVAFSAAESTLYVDSSLQGVADMAITLQNVTSLSLSDFTFQQES
jgi:serralysin